MLKDDLIAADALRGDISDRRLDICDPNSTSELDRLGTNDLLGESDWVELSLLISEGNIGDLTSPLSTCAGVMCTSGFPSL